MAKRIVSAIDVGTTKVCTIIADVAQKEGVRIIGVGVTPSAGLHKGLVVNINEAKESIRESIRQAEHTSNVKIDSAYIGVTGRHITSTNNHAVVAITRNDRLVRGDDLKRVLQAARKVDVSSERKLLHAIPRAYSVDGQQGVENPVGMHGFRLDVETHVITATMSSLQNLTKCIRSVGIDIDDLVLEPLASSEAVLSEDEKRVGVILADIGGGTTDVAIFREGSIWHTAILPVAGYQVTRDIAIGLGLPFEVAEEMKRKFGSVMPVYEGADSESPTTISEDGHGVSYQDMCDIIRARAEEVLRLILLELPRSEYESIVPAGLVLTGGSSNLPGLDALGRDILSLPVRIGVPTNISGISDLLLNPAHSTGVGLLLWGAKYGKAQPWRSNPVSSAPAGLKGLASRLLKLFR
ncbi:MAG: cell division protein FtsA [Chloroflexi bacterium]|nr:cell division protein FtsA [Chloroflexota bacterium]